MPASRRTSIALLCLVFAASSGSAAGAVTASPRWDHPGYDAGDSFYNPDESGIVSGTVGGLAKTWSVTLRSADESCLGAGSPVVRDGRVFVSDGLGISAYSARTGVLGWSFTVVDPLDTTRPRLALDGGVLLAGTSSCRPSGSASELTALDVATGRIRWQTSLGQPMGSMVVDQGVVVVSGYSDIFDDAQTTAYRTADGRMLWSKEGYVAADISAGGTVLIRELGGDSRATTAVAIGTGVARWTRTGDWFAQAADRDRLYVLGAGGDLCALDPASGRTRWTVPIEADAEIKAGYWGDRLAIDGKRVYRAYRGAVEALDARTGKRVWKTGATGDPHQPILAGGLVYAGGSVRNATDGKPAGPSFTGDLVVTGAQLFQVGGHTLTAYAPR